LQECAGAKGLALESFWAQLVGTVGGRDRVSKFFWIGIEVGTPDVDVDFSQLLVLRMRRVN
jgi:hypothetical protein